MRQIFNVFLALSTTINISSLLAVGHETKLLTLSEEAVIDTERFQMMPKEYRQNPLLDTTWMGDDSKYLYRIDDRAYTYLSGQTLLGDKVRLEDGSVWDVSPYYQNLLISWTTSDPIFIKPNAACFSRYRYVLQNRITEEIVQVNLVNPPAVNGPFTYVVAAVDPENRLILMDDGMIWRVKPGEYAFHKIPVGASLIVGVNNKWRVATYPHILIIVDMYQAPYIEAERYTPSSQVPMPPIVVETPTQEPTESEEPSTEPNNSNEVPSNTGEIPSTTIPGEEPSTSILPLETPSSEIPPNGEPIGENPPTPATTSNETPETEPAEGGITPAPVPVNETPTTTVPNETPATEPTIENPPATVSNETPATEPSGGITTPSPIPGNEIPSTTPSPSNGETVPAPSSIVAPVEEPTHSPDPVTNENPDSTIIPVKKALPEDESAGRDGIKESL